MKYRLLIVIILTFWGSAFGQVREVGIIGAFTKHQESISVMAGYDWELWKSKRFAFGTGIRFTSYFATDQYYKTAPAKLTSGNTGPFVIFKEDIDENIDTFLIQSPQVNFINVFINLRYRVSARIHVGFNIDAIGFSFGGKRNGEYINRSESPASITEQASPTVFNVLLISDNDRGSLNSELYVKYYLDKMWSLKISTSFLFTEYTTKTEVQQYPDANDRFRNKSLMLGLGVGYKF